jgi:sulfotransferase family protein
VSLRVVGAGLGRTGTHSLQLALQQLLGGRCYHMMEVFGRPEDIPIWHAAAEGTMPDWDALFADYVTGVDWPVAAFWREISAWSPDALVLLSVRDDSDAWWKSASATIFEVGTRGTDDPLFASQLRMVKAVFERTFTPDWQDEAAAKAAYERHNDTVRAEVPAERLLEWRPGDGWEPICTALDVPVPDEPFPHVNTTADFRTMAGFDSHP